MKKPFLGLLGIVLFLSPLFARAACVMNAYDHVWTCSLKLPSHAVPVMAYFKTPDPLPDPKEGLKYALIFHLHGIYQSDADIDSYRFAEKIGRMVPGYLILMPRTRGTRRDYTSLAWSRGTFKNILKQAQAALSKEVGTKIAFDNRIILSAHSGGYYTAARMLLHSSTVFDSSVKRAPRIEVVVLFDALYDDDEVWTFQRFARAKKKFLALYRQANDSGTWHYHRMLLAWLKPAHVAEAEMTASNLSAAGPLSVFWTSDDHFDLVRNWYDSAVEHVGEALFNAP